MTTQTRPAPSFVRSLSDLGNAERLIDLHGHDLHHVADWNSWLVWDGQRWIRDARQEVRRRIHDVTSWMKGEEGLADGDDHLKAIRANATRLRNNSGTVGCMSQAAAFDEIALTPDQLDTDPWMFNTPGGTVDLRTGRVHPHRREDLLTKVSTGAVTDHVTLDTPDRCPTWHAHLRTICAGDDELIEWLQMAVGYSLTGSTREQCMFVCYGTGANGKTRTLEAVHHTMGDYSMTTPVQTLMQDDRGGGIPNDVARLRGARFVTAAESEENDKLSEALVKRLTGDDTIVARFMRAEFFEFKPELKIWVGVNHRPVVKGTDHGIWRRMRLVPFTVTIPAEQQDNDLAAKLQAEADGILTWAIKGCLKWQAKPGGLGVPEVVRLATEQYRQDMDVVGRFLSERCVFLDGVNTPSRDLYREYVRWAEEEGHKPYSSTRFGSDMRDRGHPSQAHGPTRRKHYMGIAIKTDTTESPL